MDTTTTDVPAAGAHGGDGARVAAALGMDPATVVDLSASLNPVAPDVVALARSTHHLGALGHYPDPAAATAALARAIGVDPDRLVLTNGGAEAIALVASELCEGDVEEPEFSLYRRHLRAVRTGAPRWRSNPSNPCGTLAPRRDRAEVWDEAFFPLATGSWTRGDDSAWRLGSLTKLWACPGLRLGYVIAPDPAAATQLVERQARWSVNGLALSLLPDLLARTDLPAWATRVASIRRRFAAELAGLGFAVSPTAVNWVLVDEPGLRSRLALHGVVVRDCASFGLPATHRVALPTDATFDRVVSAFAAVAPR